MLGQQRIWHGTTNMHAQVAKGLELAKRCMQLLLQDGRWLHAMTWCYRQYCNGQSFMEEEEEEIHYVHSCSKGL